ncbi:MAG: alpha/beta hydrolase [Cyanobacteria bacterium J06648_16]
MQKQQIQLSEYTAGYVDCGSGPTLLFLHGFFGSSANWQALIEPLSQNYRCVALDLLGFGDSSKPWLKYNIWHQVDFLTEFIAALGLEDITLLGHSYGGWTSAAFAVRYAPSQQPKSLILIAPAGIRDDSFVGRYNHLKPLLWESPLVDLGVALLKPISALIGQRDFYERIYEVRQALTQQPVAKSFLVDRLRPEDAIDTVEKDIHAIQVPTLVVAGVEDSTIPLWHCQAYAERIPKASIVTLTDAEHDLIQTHVTDITRSIKTLLTPQKCSQ